MPRDEAKEPQTTLERLLNDLSVLESCTREVLQEVKSILLDAEERKLSSGQNKPGAKSNKNNATTNGADPKARLGPAELRGAQRIVKACLVSLSSTSRKISTGNKLDETIPQRPQKKSSKALKTRSREPPALQLSPVQVLFQCCTIALEAWSDGIRVSAPWGRLPILKARYNLLARLLDANMLAQSFSQLQSIHDDIKFELRYTQGTEEDHPIYESTSIGNYMLYKYTDDLVLDTKLLIMSIQGCVLKYSFQVNDGNEHDVMTFIERPGGPVEWCQRLLQANTAQGTLYYNALNRHLLRLASRLSPVTHFETHLKVLRIALQSAMPDWQLNAEALCHLLPVITTSEQFHALCPLAKRVLKDGFTAESPISKDTMTMLSERMSKLQSLLCLPEDAITWSRPEVCQAHKSEDLCLVIDYASSDIAQCTTQLSNHTISQHASSILNACTADFEISQTEDLIQCANKLRWTLVGRLKSDLESTDVTGDLLQVLLVPFSKLSKPLKATTLHSVQSVVLKIIEGWVFAIQIRNSDAIPSHRIQDFRLCLELVAKYQLDGKFLSVLVYNTGGLLYTRKDFPAAAEWLELYLSIEREASVDPKKVEYVWSAYLYCSNLAKAYEWLTHALTIIISNREVSEADLFCEMDTTQSDLRRVLQKLTTLITDFPEYSFPRLHNVSVKLEGIILEMHISQLEGLKPSGRISQMCAAAVAILMQLYEVDQYSLERLRSLTASLTVFQLCEDSERFQQHIALTHAYRSWFPQQNLTGIAALYETLFLMHNLYRTNQDENQLTTIIESVRLQMEKLDPKQGNTSLLLVRILEALIRTARRFGRGLDLLRSSELLLRLGSSLSTFGEIDLLKLELNTIAGYLDCGYDGQASLCLTRATRRIQSIKPDTLLRARFIRLQIQYLSTIGQYDEILARITLLNKYMNEKKDTTDASELQYIGLSCLSLWAEAKGNLAAGTRFELQALSYLRKAVARRVKHNISAKNDSVEVLVSSLNRLSLRSSYDPSEHLVRCMLRLTALYERSGAIKDALHYCTEAQTAARELSDSLSINATNSTLSRIQFLAKKIVTVDIAGSDKGLCSQNPVQDATRTLLVAKQIVELDEAEGIRQLEANLETLRTISDVNVVFGDYQQRGNSSSSDKNRKVKSQKSLTSTVLLDAQRIETLTSLYNLYTKLDRQSGIGKCINEIDRLQHWMVGPNVADLTLATHKFHAAENLLAADPVYGVLQDSALSLPSVCGIAVPPQTSKKRLRKQPEGQSKLTEGTTDEIKRLLKESKSMLTSDFDDCLSTGDSFAANQRSALHSFLNLFLSAIVDPTAEAPLRSLSSNYFLEISRGIPVIRAQERRADALCMREQMSWHDSLSSFVERRSTTLAEFQADYVDTLPADWTVVSIGLSPTNADLILSRMQSSRSPLILRLPMSRHKSRDVDEDTFEYDEAKNELQDIIRLSDASAQHAKNIKSSQGKIEWWAARKALDARLKTLLENMEHCWLGGFKGALNSSRIDTVASDQFRSSFAKIILKHVPFRKSRPFDLDSRILHLFTDLGQVDENDSLELLEDLLYFVLDIYQFHGESIAYDEIDIDQMVVDIQAALQTYLQTIGQCPASQHLVLILDKSVHMFPWESLPCLRGKSISRVPSLAILKSLLEQEDNPSRVHVPRNEGRFVLNPGGDLKTTEATFRERLNGLPAWSGIVARKPLESEILTFLESNSIYVYFGHGGGEQYVRAGKIKSLMKCAVAILMGCSSGALRDQGVYDPWGTPYDYMVAKW